MKPIRVLLACDHIDYGGALHGGGRQLIELTRALMSDGRIAPTVVVLGRASPLGRDLQAEGLPFRFFGDARYSPAPLGRLLGTITRERVEVVQLTDFAASTWGRLAGALTRRPVIVQVITHHSEFTNRGYPRHVELVYRALAPLTDRALAISGSVAEFARHRMGFSEAQTEVLYYPLPVHSLREPAPERVAAVRRAHGIPEGAPLVGAVSRFFAVKGIRYLVDAFPGVLAAHPEARLLLVGSGPEGDALRARAGELGIAERVVFAGFQRDAAAYTAAFDVAVVPSLEEGFGLVAIEAMSLGVPVVASRVGGLPEVIADGRSGLLVPPADPAGIAEAVNRLLHDAALRRRLVDEARITARGFSLDRYAGRLIEIYQELAGRAAPYLGPHPGDP